WVRRSVTRPVHDLPVVTDAHLDPGAEPPAAAAPPADRPEAHAAAMPDRLAYLRMIGLAALIGTPAAFVAAAFLALVHDVEHWLWTDPPDALGGHQPPPGSLVIGLPIVGAVIVIAARLLLPGDGGHSPLLGVAGGPTALKAGPGV